MVRPVSCSLRLAAVVALLALPVSGGAQAQPVPARVRVTFQPDCFRTSDSSSAPCAPRKSGTRLDLGPQIAVWIEGADGRFVDTVLVTNMTARLGIGNRPGHYLFPSGPKFPYGRRLGALPVWAHHRGKLYDSLVMQDGTDMETWLGFHERVSSPDPYFCRPMTFMEIDVDAISCPTAVFNSVKGRFFNPSIDLGPSNLQNGRPKDYVPPARCYYPPRNDLTTFTDSDCDGTQFLGCPISAEKYAAINDLDDVAAATPAYGQPFSQLWRVPDAVADGDYVLLVEVNKEFDESPAHRHPAMADPMLSDWGLTNNFGQPSVVYRLPFRLDRRTATQSAVTEIAGYGDWDGQTGTLHPPDSSIIDVLGSGRGRLLAITQPSISGGAPVSGRVHLVTELGPEGPPATEPPPDAGVDGADGPAAPAEGGVVAPVADAASVCLPAALDVQLGPVMSEAAEIELQEPTREQWDSTDSYEVRVWNGLEKSAAAFEEGRPLPRVTPVRPGSHLTVSVDNLKSQSQYTVGVRASGACPDQPIAFATFTTVVREYKQLSGCFIATAAYGGPLAAQVQVLRRLRDRAGARSAVANVVAELYARASPPVAGVLRETEVGRAAVRALLSPVMRLLKNGVP